MTLLPGRRYLRIYLGGPMRRKRAFNFHLFMDVAEQLRAEDHEVFNPAEQDINKGFDPTGMTGYEDLAELGFDLRAALAADLDWIAKNADAIYLLPGWENSKGAVAEHALAVALGLQVFEHVEQEAVGAYNLGRELQQDIRIWRESDVVRLETEGSYPPVVVEVTGKEGPPRTVTNEVRTVSATGGEKGSKLARYDLIPADPLKQVAEVYGHGATKYADRNWERGYDWSLSFAAMMRHAWAFWNGEDTDPEFGTNHLAHAVWHGLALLEFMGTQPGYDNRPSSVAKTSPETTSQAVHSR